MIENTGTLGEAVDKSLEIDQPIQPSGSEKAQDDTELDETDLDEQATETSDKLPKATETPSEQIVGSIDKSVDNDKEMADVEGIASRMPSNVDLPGSTEEIPAEDPLVKFEKLLDIMSKETIGANKEVPERENLRVEASDLEMPEGTNIIAEKKIDIVGTETDKENEPPGTDVKTEVPDVIQSEQQSAGEMVETVLETSEGSNIKAEKTADIDGTEADKEAEVQGTDINTEIPDVQLKQESAGKISDAGVLETSEGGDKKAEKKDDVEGTETDTEAKVSETDVNTEILDDIKLREHSGAGMIEAGAPKTAEDSSINAEKTVDVGRTEDDMEVEDRREPVGDKLSEKAPIEYEKLDSPEQQTINQLKDERTPETRESMDDNLHKPQHVETEVLQGHEVTEEAKHDEDEEDDHKNHQDEDEEDAKKKDEPPSEGLF